MVQKVAPLLCRIE